MNTNMSNASDSSTSDGENAAPPFPEVPTIKHQPKDDREDSTFAAKFKKYSDFLPFTDVDAVKAVLSFQKRKFYEEL